MNATRSLPTSNLLSSGRWNTGLDTVHSGGMDTVLWCSESPGKAWRGHQPKGDQVKTECGADDSPTASSTLSRNYGVLAKYKRNEFTKDEMQMTIKHIKSMGHQKQS